MIRFSRDVNQSTELPTEKFLQRDLMGGLMGDRSCVRDRRRAILVLCHAYQVGVT